MMLAGLFEYLHVCEGGRDAKHSSSGCQRVNGALLQAPVRVC